MNPVMTGAWDGSHLWLQWEGDGPAEVSISFGTRIRLFTAKRPWFHISIPEAGGKEITATVNEVAAVEARFLFSRCKFEWKAGSSPVSHSLTEAVTVAALVDGAVCAYKLLESISLAPECSCVTEMEAYQAAPWCQLDHPDHFTFALPDGGLVRNVEPSISDYELTGATSTRLSTINPGPFILLIPA